MNIQTEDKGNLTRYTKNMMISMHGMFKHPAEVVVEGEGDGGEEGEGHEQREAQHGGGGGGDDGANPHLNLRLAYKTI